MRTVQNVEEVTLKVTKDELIEDKWITCQLLSIKISEIEKNNNLRYKSLRSRMYNSLACGKYNVENKAGIKCVNVEEPMKGTASLKLTFERV